MLSTTTGQRLACKQGCGGELTLLIVQGLLFSLNCLQFSIQVIIVLQLSFQVGAESIIGWLDLLALSCSKSTSQRQRLQIVHSLFCFRFVTAEWRWPWGKRFHNTVTKVTPYLLASLEAAWMTAGALKRSCFCSRIKYKVASQILFCVLGVLLFCRFSGTYRCLSA